jgi:hypothetical protein
MWWEPPREVARRLEIVDEATLQKIIQDIAGHEKQGQK